MPCLSSYLCCASLIVVFSMLHLFTSNIVIVEAAVGDILWEDSFNDADLGINPRYWTHAVGDGCDAPPGCGWGNQELGVYTTNLDNVNVTGGQLHLTARRTSFAEYDSETNEVLAPASFTSGRIHTAAKVEFQYGTLMARIQIPSSIDAGLWPAFWTLGADWPETPWPESGEIDIMEFGSGSSIATGDVHRRVTSGAHWADPNGRLAAYASDVNYEYGFLNGSFAIYKMDWTPSNISTWVLQDGRPDQMIWSMDTECESCEEFHKPHFVLLNLAVGGLFTSVWDTTTTTDLDIEYTSSSAAVSTNIFQNAACSAHSKCLELNLSGDCCPTKDGLILGCCDVSVESISSSSSSTSSFCSSSSGGSSFSSTSSSSSSSSSSSDPCSTLIARTEISAPTPAVMSVDWIRIVDNGFTQLTVTNPPTSPTLAVTSTVHTTQPHASPSEAPQMGSSTTTSTTTASIGSPPTPTPMTLTSPTYAPVEQRTTYLPTLRPSSRGSTSNGDSSSITSSSGKGKGGKGGKGKSNKNGKGKGGKGKGKDGYDTRTTTSALAYQSNPSGVDDRRGSLYRHEKSIMIISSLLSILAGVIATTEF